MVLLLVALRWTPVRDSVAAVAEFLLAHRSLLFVPVGVGVMTHLGLLSQYGLRQALAALAASPHEPPIAQHSVSADNPGLQGASWLATQ